MPCQSDYLAQSGQELESVRVCRLLVYLYVKINKDIPEWIKTAANYYYGNIGRLDEATKMLCECCRSLTTDEVEKYIYNARDETARQLASWWEKHQEWDKRRVAEEDAERKRVILKERALNKLTVEEIRVLGL